MSPRWVRRPHIAHWIPNFMHWLSFMLKTNQARNEKRLDFRELLHQETRTPFVNIWFAKLPICVSVYELHAEYKSGTKRKALGFQGAAPQETRTPFVNVWFAQLPICASVSELRAGNKSGTKRTPSTNPHTARWTSGLLIYLFVLFVLDLLLENEMFGLSSLLLELYAHMTHIYAYIYIPNPGQHGNDTLVQDGRGCDGAQFWS